jgi:hypothetical protein
MDTQTGTLFYYRESWHAIKSITRMSFQVATAFELNHLSKFKPMILNRQISGSQLLLYKSYRDPYRALAVLLTSDAVLPTRVELDRMILFLDVSLGKKARKDVAQELIEKKREVNTLIIRDAAQHWSTGQIGAVAKLQGLKCRERLVEQHINGQQIQSLDPDSRKELARKIAQNEDVEYLKIIEMFDRVSRRASVASESEIIAWSPSQVATAMELNNIGQYKKRIIEHQVNGKHLVNAHKEQNQNALMELTGISNKEHLKRLEIFLDLCIGKTTRSEVPALLSQQRAMRPAIRKNNSFIGRTSRSSSRNNSPNSNSRRIVPDAGKEMKPRRSLTFRKSSRKSSETATELLNEATSLLQLQLDTSSQSITEEPESDFDEGVTIIEK